MDPIHVFRTLPVDNTPVHTDVGVVENVNPPESGTITVTYTEDW